jgi:peroxiredoxin
VRFVIPSEERNPHFVQLTAKCRSLVRFGGLGLTAKQTNRADGTRVEPYSTVIIGARGNALKNKLLSGVILVAVAALILIVVSPSSRQGERGAAGTSAPDFPFQLDGREIHLSALRGKVIVLNFWATWCPPCVEEMPSLNRLHQHIAPLGAMVLGVSVDENQHAYEKFLREHQIAFPNHRDPSRHTPSSYGTEMFPETYIIGKDGKIARKIIGPQQWDRPEMLDYLRGLIAEPK